jgi:hypothetical protein
MLAQTFYAQLLQPRQDDRPSTHPLCQFYPVFAAFVLAAKKWGERGGRVLQKRKRSTAEMQDEDKGDKSCGQ